MRSAREHPTHRRRKQRNCVPGTEYPTVRVNQVRCLGFDTFKSRATRQLSHPSTTSPRESSFISCSSTARRLDTTSLLFSADTWGMDEKQENTHEKIDRSIAGNIPRRGLRVVRSCCEHERCVETSKHRNPSSCGYVSNSPRGT